MISDETFEKFRSMLYNPAYMFRELIGEPTPFQLSILDEIMDGDRNRTIKEPKVIFKRDRNVGFTAAIALYIVWFAFKYPTNNVVVVDTQQNHINLSRVVYDLFDRLDAMLKANDLDFDYKGMFETRNKTELRLANGTRVLFKSTSASAVRGLSISLLIMNNITKDSEMYYNAMPAVYAKQGQVIRLFDNVTPDGPVDLSTTPQDMLT